MYIHIYIYSHAYGYTNLININIIEKIVRHHFDTITKWDCYSNYGFNILNYFITEFFKEIQVNQTRKLKK